MKKAYDAEGTEYIIIGESIARSQQQSAQNDNINSGWMKMLTGAGIGVILLALVAIAAPKPQTPMVITNNNTITNNIPPSKTCGLLSFLIGC
jgi:hypothetical protein